MFQIVILFQIICCVLRANCWRSCYEGPSLMPNAVCDVRFPLLLLPSISEFNCITVYVTALRFYRVYRGFW